MFPHSLIENQIKQTYELFIAVDGLVTCSQQASRGKGSDGGGSGSNSILGTNFPFVKDHVFTATLWAGLEGFHMNVNGKHETSFTYREVMNWFSFCIQIHQIGLFNHLDLQIETRTVVG